MGLGTQTLHRQALAACCLAACLASNLFADVIVLKNGRRIVASDVKEAGDKVIGETPHGTITLPVSLVDHIQRDGMGNSPAAALRWDRPESPGVPEGTGAA